MAKFFSRKFLVSLAALVYPLVSGEPDPVKAAIAAGVAVAYVLVEGWIDRAAVVEALSTGRSGRRFRNG